MQNLPSGNQQYSEQPYQNQPNQPYYPQDIQQGAPNVQTNGKTQIAGLDYNIAGLLCYSPIGLIASLAFLFTEPRTNRFVRFHAAQSLVLGVGLTVLFFALMIVSFIIAQIPVVGPIIGLLLMLLMMALSFGMLGFFIFMMVKAYQGQMWKMPAIGNIAENLSNQIGGK